jgi:hypothetical protein
MITASALLTINNTLRARRNDGLLRPASRLTSTRTDAPEQLYHRIASAGGLNAFLLVVLEYVPGAVPQDLI